MNIVHESNKKTLSIPISEISVGEFNVRKNLDAGSEDSTIEDLAKSIHLHGLLNPIIVKEKEGKYELIIGQRRYLACQLLGWQKIPVIISDVDDLEARILSLIENVHRADLHPLDKGLAYQQLYTNFKTYTQVSKETGVSTQTIKRYMLLLKLAPSIQELLTTSDGPAGICTLSLLAKLFPDFDEQEYVLERIGGFKQQVQEEILKRSGGDVSLIDLLTQQALGGCFNVFICQGLKSCPNIPEEGREEILQLIEKMRPMIPVGHELENSAGESPSD
jgi:ParB family chromosome partitioning protein